MAENHTVLLIPSTNICHLLDKYLETEGILN
jgi:hypothetical protein